MDSQKPKEDLSFFTAGDVEGIYDYLLESAAVFMVVVNRDGVILQANHGLFCLLGKTASALVGESLWPFLIEPDSIRVQNLLQQSAKPKPLPFFLNFVDDHLSPVTVICRLSSDGTNFRLLGERPAGEEENLSANLLQLNNQLSVLSRENVRKSRALEKALSELKQAQVMLVHQEKMASMGQMTAGVAHEINNPIAYVLSNQETLRRDFEDLFGFINVVGDSLPEMAERCPDLEARIIEKAAECDLEYLAEGIPRKIEASLEGLERVRDIVLDLRTFSRLDEAETKECDLAENIESAILFLSPLIKQHQVEIDTSFASMEPLVCAPSTLNQAISNILSNAIQASRPGQKVQVSTADEKDEVVICIKDQGMGIAPEHQSKIFDPFFTTKPVGSGTGLGLSITHQIISAQGGKLQVESALNEGTCMRIFLPRPHNVK